MAIQQQPSTPPKLIYPPTPLITLPKPYQKRILLLQSNVMPYTHSVLSPHPIVSPLAIILPL